MNKTLESLNFKPDLAIPPGETLKETLESLGMSQTELALRMGRPVKTINEIINGKAAITAETALQLEKVFGVTAQFWINLEMQYQTTKARIEMEKELIHQVSAVDKFPYTEMANWGWVAKTQNRIERVNEILSFFGVNSINNLDYNFTASYRCNQRNIASKEALAVWLRQGERLASGKPANRFNESKFIEALYRIRNQTINTSKQILCDEVPSICAECGVIIVYVPHLRKTYVNGATRWLSSEKALIQLSIRNRYEDIFWFTFFHEACHILKHGKRDKFVDFDQPGTSEKEIEADRFAADFLIPLEKYNDFLQLGDFSRLAIKKFADEIGICPAVLVGRLQHDDIIPHSRFNHIRRKLMWVDE
jgi:HTH-type transcriptional regulator / antitoxin HigA